LYSYETRLLMDWKVGTPRAD